MKALNMNNKAEYFPVSSGRHTHSCDKPDCHYCRIIKDAKQNKSDYFSITKFINNLKIK